MHSDASKIYVEACRREHAECALELVYAFDNNEKEVSLSDRAVHLNDLDITCIAEALRSTTHSIRALNLEGNAFGLQGLQSLLEAIEENPGIISELRLGRNMLKDQAAVVIGHTLSRDGCGLKILDLSENDITKLGVIPIAAALSNETCDIVELSFYNNKIEADAATYLSQAIHQASKLRHLHLGYNAIRDTGAAQLAKCIMNTVGLSTLDLTANRIGASGGKDLAKALMASTCNIQRLNLRHNLFDSETIEMYADVLRNNTSLIQLFLGFMNPSPESAATVLSALCENRTLLLLDIYGWKLPQENTWGIIDDIQKSNFTLAAIVTDGCQPIAKLIDRGNDERDERGQHPIYVGPDDHDAYVATRSLRRFSRAQSRRQSRASSRGAVSSRTGSPANRRKNERSSSRRDSETRQRSSSRRQQDHLYHSTVQDPLNPTNQDLKKENNQNQYQPQPQPKPQPPQPYNQYNQQNIDIGVPRNSGVEVLPKEFTYTNLDLQTSDATKKLMENLLHELSEQKKVQRELEARVAALERRRECKCVSNAITTKDQISHSNTRTHSSERPNTHEPGNHTPQPQQQHQMNSREEDPRSPEVALRHRASPDHTSGPHRTTSAPRGRSADPAPREMRGGRGGGSAGDPHSYSQGHSPTPTPRYNSRPHIPQTHQSQAASTPSAAERRSVSGSSGGWGGPAEPPQPTEGRTELSEPPAEPLELPKERQPPGVALQTSTRPPKDFHSYLGPAPSKDKDPPRRKGSVQHP